MAQHNIYCKIELIKDPNTGQLSLTAHLNPQATNITTDEHTISWTPTHEEQQFLIDAIHLLKNQQQSPVVTFTKKQPKSHIHEKQKKDNEIESINQTIDNLPVNKKESTQKNYGQDTIDHIIKQNTKQQ
jgi:hypothetical protein